MMKSKQFIKNNDFRLIFFILVGFFISENGFAQPCWNRNDVLVTLVPQTNFIVITTKVYHYPYSAKSEFGYLSFCRFKASVDKKNYFDLMEIETPLQNKKNLTQINFKNKLDKALIVFTNEYFAMNVGLVWSDYFKKNITISVPNYQNISAVILKWGLGSEYRDVRYIRISGKWRVGGRYTEAICEVYDLYKPNQNALKSNTPDTITKKSENDPVNILKNAEAIVVKGADPGANIKVYSKSGVEIKSVISDNDVVNIKLPANQIYIVHIGKSRYKVAL